MPRSSGVLSQQPSTSRQNRSRENPSPRPGTSQPQQNGATDDDPDHDQMVINLVKVILNLSVNKHPIKKVDLVKNALGGNSRLFAKVIPQAMSELTDVRIAGLANMTGSIVASVVFPGLRIQVDRDGSEQNVHSGVDRCLRFHLGRKRRLPAKVYTALPDSGVHLHEERRSA